MLFQKKQCIQTIKKRTTTLLQEMSRFDHKGSCADQKTMVQQGEANVKKPRSKAENWFRSIV